MVSKTFIIGVSGKLRHGKDTIGDYLVRRYGFKKVSFADKLKQICMSYDNTTPELRSASNQQIARELFNGKATEQQVDALMQWIEPGVWRKLTEEECYMTKPAHARRKMQLLGEGARQQIQADCWVAYALRKCHEEGGRFVIADLRYKNEAFAIEMQPNAQLWRVFRDAVETDQFGKHISEVDLDDYPFEVFIDNNGSLRELYDTVDKVVRPLLQGNRPFASGKEVY